MFVARPPETQVPARELALVRAVRADFAGPAAFLAASANRARVADYLSDLATAYGTRVDPERFTEAGVSELGHSYGEMAQALIAEAVRPDEPVDLSVLAYAVHDLWPNRQTAAYLSHLTPGAPMSFALCDQGSAAAFSGLRLARDYSASAGVRRALLTVVEQAALPYDTPAALPARHQGVALLFGESAAPLARVTDLRQHAKVAPADAPGLAAAFTKLASAEGRSTVLVSESLAPLWTDPAADRVRVLPPGQPATGVWWALAEELESPEGRPELAVIADYDAELRYLSLAAFDTRPV